MIFKEIRQMTRDPGTVGMMLAMPLVQLMIFGFAINNDPRRLPMAIEVNDTSVFARSIDAALRNTTYFRVTRIVGAPGEGERLLKRGDVQFVVTIPVDFGRDLVRGERPQLLVTADATDPAATGNALSAIDQAVAGALSHDLIGPLAARAQGPSPVDLVIHRSYNPEGITSHNTVPGLLAVVLSMTMVMLTALSVTREVEQGTMENLLATPLRPFEVMVGKIVPYLFIGVVQMAVILLAAHFVFHVPFAGSIGLTLASTLLFMVTSLALGFTLSTIAGSQLQAMQMSFFYMLPSILLSGFAFPYRGMPRWAQWGAEVLPTTHFIRLVRGIMLKGWTLGDALPHLAVLVLMLVVLGTVAVRRYQDTVA
ncbi:ABC transporter permease [Novosphingobium sp. KCTC 2891]|uniref:ABC transporter permease n=1 Tax=Novosphingobium sp. KCTC 2891 TaxID=2989730 RepID=UPI002221FFC3|nr:ABC transporter permease [Novosphingobium sp. KCTC 2891]MCW1382793.1 ABC transporter permease [Novosphingobium sp. KCTC 2891]